MKNQRGFTLYELLTLILSGVIILGIIGWALNINKLATILLATGTFEWTSIVVLRIIGIFPIVGAFVGWM